MHGEGTVALTVDVDSDELVFEHSGNGALQTGHIADRYRLAALGGVSWRGMGRVRAEQEHACKKQDEC